MYKNGAKFIKENNSIIHYRKFFEDNSSLHIHLRKKPWGFAFNAHMDLFIHRVAIFDKITLKFLSKLYVFLKNKGGARFLLPRQEKAFQSFLGKNFPRKKPQK